MTYTHDPNGNVNGTSAGQIFTYDPFNRMIQAVSSGGTATYTYNGDGLKIQRIGPDGATRYYHDGIRPIWETDGAGAMTAQLDRDVFGNLLSRREASGTRRYYHPDGLGSTVALSDEAGGVAASMLYDAWGNVRANAGAGHGRYRFTGAELDEASGFYHMGARFYDPAIGRWLSEDPLQSSFEPMSLNFYAYVHNNPLIYVDPSGLCDQKCLEDLNARRQELASGTSDWRDYIAARELARSLETVVDRDRAFEIAGSYLDKIATGVDRGTALEASIREGLKPVSAGNGKSMVRDVVLRIGGGFLLLMAVGTGSIVVYEVRHHGAGALFTGAPVMALNTILLTLAGGCLLVGGSRCGGPWGK